VLVRDRPSAPPPFIAGVEFIDSHPRIHTFTGAVEVIAESARRAAAFQSAQRNRRFNLL
jgi:hypothetical protein